MDDTLRKLSSWMEKEEGLEERASLLRKGQEMLLKARSLQEAYAEVVQRYDAKK